MINSRYTPSLVAGVPTGSPPGTARLSWQEFFVVLVAAGLMVFFNVRGMPVVTSVGLAAGAVLVFMGLITVPRAVGRVARRYRAALATVDAHPTVDGHVLEQRP